MRINDRRNEDQGSGSRLDDVPTLDAFWTTVIGVILVIVALIGIFK